ncbi:MULTISPECIES: hypothetical protein [Marinobacter]|uniref:hypothetical protein n=1 Tax=Marinobacter TaxID=2742 RepID=UPI00117BEB9D|nr:MULTISPECIES: hypothetical protein [Marinobacter]MBD3657132.1 hypothetical protein [Marinobacter sp.]
MAFSLPAGRILSVCRRTGAAAALYVVALAVHAEDQPAVEVTIEAVTAVTAVARFRLGRYLESADCPATIRFGEADRNTALAFRFSPAADEAGEEAAPVLVALNRQRRLPQPVWVSRRTAGVTALGQLEDRDLATVGGADPLGADLPLAALGGEGVRPGPERLYQAGDYSSALGLLLHNNTYAAVSELGFVLPLLDSNGLAVTWAGEPVMAAGWYRGPAWRSGALACEQALQRLSRADDRQVFVIFPEWVDGFAGPQQQISEDDVQ